MTSPTPAVREELEQLLDADPSRLGQVYRLDRKGLDAKRIASELGVSTSNFVVNNRTIARALLEGALPNGPAISRIVAGAVRRRATASGLSHDAQTYLASLLDRLSPDTAQDGQPAGQQRTVTPAIATLRVQVEEELARRARDLIKTIRDEAGIDADDYHRIPSARSALDALTRLIQVQATSRTTKALHRVDRLDLSIEAAAVEWANDLPLAKDLTDTARARLDYWRSE